MMKVLEIDNLILKNYITNVSTACSSLPQGEISYCNSLVHERRALNINYIIHNMKVSDGPSMCKYILHINGVIKEQQNLC